MSASWISKIDNRQWIYQLGTIIVGEVNYFSPNNNENKKYVAGCKLPMMYSRIGDFDDLESAKKKVEKVVMLWIELADLGMKG